jgi:hypothetical protein
MQVQPGSAAAPLGGRLVLETLEPLVGLGSEAA